MHRGQHELNMNKPCNLPFLRAWPKGHIQDQPSLTTLVLTSDWLPDLPCPSFEPRPSDSFRWIPLPWLWPTEDWFASEMYWQHRVIPEARFSPGKPSWHSIRRLTLRSTMLVWAITDKKRKQMARWEQQNRSIFVLPQKNRAALPKQSGDPTK